jgi:hypothetical protein
MCYYILIIKRVRQVIARGMTSGRMINSGVVGQSGVGGIPAFGIGGTSEGCVGRDTRTVLQPHVWKKAWK